MSDKMELSEPQAWQYLHDLQEVLYGLAITLTACAALCDRTPEGAPPEAMLNSLAECWETLDSRFNEVYLAVYGNDAKVDDSSAGTDPETGLGPKELQ